MTGRSMVSQGLYLQKETSPGTPEITAMKRVLGIKGTPGWEIAGDDFRASGYKVNTSRITNTEQGRIAVETVQDFNAWLWTLCGGFGAPTSEVDGVEPTVYNHTYTLNARQADPRATFTAMWGDSTKALQMAYVVFQSLGITVNRSGLSLETAMIGRKPVTGISLPASGAITEVPSIPVSSRQWNVYIDDTWEDLGTTQMLALYSCGLTFGDKYVPDYVVNANQPSYTELIEAEDTEFSGSMQVGFDATAEGLITSFEDQAIKYIRLECLGPTIGATAIDHSLVIDVCGRITNPTDIMPAPNAPTVSLGFDLQLTVDETTGNAAQAVLTNALSGL